MDYLGGEDKFASASQATPRPSRPTTGSCVLASLA